MIGYRIEPHRPQRDGSKLCNCGTRKARFALTIMEHKWEKVYLCGSCHKEIVTFLEGQEPQEDRREEVTRAWDTVPA